MIQVFIESENLNQTSEVGKERNECLIQYYVHVMSGALRHLPDNDLKGKYTSEMQFRAPGIAAHFCTPSYLGGVDLEY